MNYSWRGKQCCRIRPFSARRRRRRRLASYRHSTCQLQTLSSLIQVLLVHSLGRIMSWLICWQAYHTLDFSRGKLAFASSSHHDEVVETCPWDTSLSNKLIISCDCLHRYPCQLCYLVFHDIMMKLVLQWTVKRKRKRTKINPLSTTGLLTLYLIGSYHEMFTCVANHDKALKMLHAQTCTRDYFSYISSD